MLRHCSWLPLSSQTLAPLWTPWTIHESVFYSHYQVYWSTNSTCVSRVLVLFLRAFVCTNWPGWLCPPGRDVLVPPARQIFLFLFVNVILFARRWFIPPKRQVSRVTLSFGYLFFARVWHKLRRVVCETKALGYARLSKCYLHAFSFYLTLQ